GVADRRHRRVHRLGDGRRVLPLTAPPPATAVTVEVIVHADAPARWPRRVQALHWLGVLLILSVAVIGLLMGELERGTEARRLAYLCHKSLGITVLALALLRVLVRATGRAPACGDAGW